MIWIMEKRKVLITAVTLLCILILITFYIIILRQKNITDIAEENQTETSTGIISSVEYPAIDQINNDYPAPQDRFDLLVIAGSNSRSEMNYEQAWNYYTEAEKSSSEITNNPELDDLRYTMFRTAIEWGREDLASEYKSKIDPASFTAIEQKINTYGDENE